MSLWTPLSLCPISFRVLSFLFIITCFPIFPGIYPLTHFHILVYFPVRFVIDFSLSPTVVREETLHTLQICWKLNCGLTWNALPPRPLENKEDSVVAGSSALCVLDLVVLTVSGLFSFQVLSLLVLVVRPTTESRKSKSLLLQELYMCPFSSIHVCFPDFHGLLLGV